MGKYDDIIDLPHPEPQTRPRMPMRDRAAQFSPFAALRGHHSAIEEAGRLTDRRIELDEYEVASVDDSGENRRAPGSVRHLFRAGRTQGGRKLPVRRRDS